MRAQPKLTARQAEVIELYVLGHSQKEIAGRLALDARTVNTHKQVAMRKLGVATNAALLRYWLTAESIEGSREVAA